MLQAIRNFKSLRSFTWVASGGHSEVTQEIFEALGYCHAINELRLGQVAPLGDHLNPDASLWKLCILTALVLRGNIWAKLGSVEDSFSSLLNNSPNLENLTMTYSADQSKFTLCALTSLLKLHLWNASIPANDFVSSDRQILNFLVAHPRIEDLRWFPFHQDLTPPSGTLPYLRRILTRHPFGTALLRDKTLFRERKMEVISQILLEPNTLELLGLMDGSHLEEIQIERFENLEAIKRLAALFPSIRILIIPNFGHPSPTGEETYALDDCIDCLACFPNLEAVLDSFLWPAMRTLNDQERVDTVTRLLTRCSKLNRIDHWDPFPSVENRVII